MCEITMPQHYNTYDHLLGSIGQATSLCVILVNLLQLYQIVIIIVTILIFLGIYDHMYDPYHRKLPPKEQDYLDRIDKGREAEILRKTTIKKRIVMRETRVQKKSVFDSMLDITKLDLPSPCSPKRKYSGGAPDDEDSKEITKKDEKESNTNMSYLTALVRKECNNDRMSLPLVESAAEDGNESDDLIDDGIEEEEEKIEHSGEAYAIMQPKLTGNTIYEVEEDVVNEEREDVLKSSPNSLFDVPYESDGERKSLTQASDVSSVGSFADSQGVKKTKKRKKKLKYKKKSTSNMSTLTTLLRSECNSGGIIPVFPSEDGNEKTIDDESIWSQQMQQQQQQQQQQMQQQQQQQQEMQQQQQQQQQQQSEEAKRNELDEMEASTTGDIGKERMSLIRLSRRQSRRLSLKDLDQYDGEEVYI